MSSQGFKWSGVNATTLVAVMALVMALVIAETAHMYANNTKQPINRRNTIEAGFGSSDLNLLVNFSMRILLLCIFSSTESQKSLSVRSGCPLFSLVADKVFWRQISSTVSDTGDHCPLRCWNNGSPTPAHPRIARPSPAGERNTCIASSADVYTVSNHREAVMVLVLVLVLVEGAVAVAVPA